MLTKIAVLTIVFASVARALAAQPRVVINEIMYAPHSPEPEWIELFNTDPSKNVDIGGWEISTITKSVILPTNLLAADQFSHYIVITTDSAALRARRPGTYAIVQCALPSLSNSGSAVVLRDAAGQTVDSLYYMPSWGGSNGQSLERKNYLKSPTDPSNWGASTDSSGATPGAQNSLSLPVAARYDLGLDSLHYSLSADTLRVSVRIVNLGNLPMDSSILTVESDTGNGPSPVFTTMLDTLDADSSITEQIIFPHVSYRSVGYTLYITSALDTSHGNDTLRFNVPEQAKALDIVMNEIMYAPVSPEPEWIELYNMDSTAIDLTGWQVATATHTGTIPYGTIPGNGYLVLTKDSLTLISLRPGSYDIVPMPLPTLPNNGAQLVLRNSTGITIDSVSYLPSWGGSTGASLERRDVTKPSTDSTNWGTSKAPIIYYGTTSATPGAINSLALPDSTVKDTNTTAKPLDVVINEVMFAPLPPEPEWIELLNTTSDTVNLDNWKVDVDGHAPLSFGSEIIMIPPDSLVVLTNNGLELAMVDSIPTSRIIDDNLPNLSNGGSTIALHDPSGNLIDTMFYDPLWDPYKGISLERIDPYKPGPTALNWAASRDPRGSTILRPNSVRKREHDLAILGVDAVDGVDTEVSFTIGNLGRDTSQQIEIRLLIDTLDTTTAIVPVFLPPDSTVQISVPFPQNFFGLFHAVAYLIDSTDEQHSNDTIRFGIVLDIPQDSLVINEIMFDPAPGSCEWLEVYNRSSSWISLDSTRLVTGEKRPGEYAHTLPQLVIPPDSLGIVAGDSSVFYQTYSWLPHTGSVAGLGISSLDLGRDSCFFTLHNLDSTTIDSVHYFKAWQQSLLRKTFVGISLERIDPAGESNNPRNWQACIDTSGATPLARNSISSSTPGDTILPAGSNFNASFTPNPFSPDGDGFEDVTTLTVQTGDAKSAYAMRVRLYDSRGVMVRMLTDATEIMGATTLTFDGKRDNGQTLPPGLYAALIELTSQSPVRTLEKAIGVVIAGRRR